MAKSATLRLDFSKEEESGGGGRIRWPEGDYHVSIVKALSGRSSDKDTPYLEVHFKVLEGKKRGKTFSERLYITPKSLKRIRLLLESIGVKVPKSAVSLPLAKLKGKSLWIELQDEERDGYDPRSRVAFEGFMSEDDYEADEDAEDDDDEDDEDLDDDEDEDDEDDDEDEDDEEDEDEEEEEPAPKKRRARQSRAKAKPAPKSRTKKRSKASDDDDEIEDLDLDEL